MSGVSNHVFFFQEMVGRIDPATVLGYFFDGCLISGEVRAFKMPCMYKGLDDWMC